MNLQKTKRLTAAVLAALLILLLSGCKKADEGLSLSVSVGDAPVSLDPIYAEEKKPYNY